MLCQLLIVADKTLSIEAQGQFSSDAFSRYQTSIFQIMQRLRGWVFWKLLKTKPKKKKKSFSYYLSFLYARFFHKSPQGGAWGRAIS